MARRDIVSVVILNYNMKGLIKGTLDSVLSSKKGNFNLEVIVIDNNSTDGSDKFIKQNYPQVKLLRSKVNIGYPAMNLALKKARGDYLFFLNNDIIIDKSCIINLHKAIKELPNDVGAVTPLRKTPEGKVIYHRKIISRSFYTCSKIEDDGKKYYEDAFTGIPFFKAKVLKDIGTFVDNDYFLYAEDLDFCFRLRIAGYRLLLVKSAVISTAGKGTTLIFQGKPKIAYYNERNLLQTYLKDLELRNVFLFFPYMASLRILSLLIELFRLNFNGIYARLKAYSWVVVNIKRIVSKRKEVQMRRKVKDSDIFYVVSDERYFISYLLRNIFSRR